MRYESCPHILTCCSRQHSVACINIAPIGDPQRPHSCLSPADCQHTMSDSGQQLHLMHLQAAQIIMLHWPCLQRVHQCLCPARQACTPSCLLDV